MRRKFNRTKLYRFITSNDKRKRTIVASIGLLLISFMSVGFAYLSKTLELSGNVTVGSDIFILVNNVVVDKMENGGVNTYSPTYNKNTITLTSTLPNLDSSITYKISFRNYSSKDEAEVESIIEDSISNDNMTYTITGLEVGDSINKESSIDAYITFTYKDTVSVLPESKDVGLIITYNFKEKTEVYEYASGNMLLNLRGLDSPVDNVWYDAEQGKAMKLTNVTYDHYNLVYKFNGNSFGTLGEPIIPITGDFTLEARITYPTNIRTVTDQSLVSQLSDTSNDTGRFKLDAQYRSNQNQLLIFMNDQKGGTNPFVIHTTNPSLGGTYVAQAVRSGSTLSVYLDGVFITSYNLNTASPISTGPFKLGTWNDASRQYYTGNISAVRVYKRALSAAELLNNKQIDDKNYTIEVPPIEPPTPQHVNLKQYAIENHAVTSGDGLYLDNLGNYTYRGISVSNYLKFNGDNDIYRIISFNTDGSMKVLNTSRMYNQPFDESGNRSFATSTYCDGSSKVADASINQMYGCNVWEKADIFTNGTTTGNVLNDATSNTYLNTIYYNSMNSSVRNRVLTHDFNVGLGKVGQSRDATNTQSTSLKWTGKIGMLTLADTMNANVASITVNSAQTQLSSYLTKMMGSLDIYWTMTTANNNTWDVYALSLGASVGKRRASRYNQSSGADTYTMYIMPSFYTNGEIEVYTGIGTESNPFIIE